MWRALSSGRGMRAAFVQKGGRPAKQHPIYLVLGSPRWMEEDHIARKGLPGEGWETQMPKHFAFAHHIETQVWNRKALVEYLELSGGNNGGLHF
jgi:hypothetical protein